MAAASYVLDPRQLLRKTASVEDRAAAVIREAEEKAAAIRAEAARELEQAKAEADRVREEAREEGRRQAHAEAFEEWKTVLQSAVDERDNVLRQLEEMSGQIEAEALGLALKMAEKIVRHEVEANPDTVVDVLRVAMHQLRDRANVKIWVNRKDIERVRDARDEMLQWTDSLRDVEVGEDRRVDRGGVILESSDGIVDARVSTQLKEITTRLKESREQ